MQFRKQVIAALFAATAGAGAVNTANAALVATIAGSDCSGVFGQGFENCQIPAQYSDDPSPIIAKFNFNANGSAGLIEINSLFPTVTADDFSIAFNSSGVGSFTYFPDAGDPLITFYVAKGGPNFNLFSNDDDPNSGSFFTPVNGGGNSAGLSHISFYDTGADVGGSPPQEIPEPGTLGLLGLAMAGAAFTARRRRKD